MLESCSTAITGVRLNGGYKCAALQFVSVETGSLQGVNSLVERGEDTHQQSQLELLVRQVEVRSLYVTQAVGCWLGKSSFAEQGKRVCLIGDAVIHQLC